MSNKGVDRQSATSQSLGTRSVLASRGEEVAPRGGGVRPGVEQLLRVFVLF
jgi:hypothetical protein